MTFRPLLLRLGISLSLLSILAWFLDIGEVLSRLGQMHVGWAALAVVVSVPQFAASAWRWCFTAARLGIALPFPVALREYYLSTFLNQILPGGVIGDLSRAWRHARTQSLGGTAVRAVILERVSAQAVMTTIAVISFLSLPVSPFSGTWVVILFVGVGLGVMASSWFLRTRGGQFSKRSLVGRVWHDINAALFSGYATFVQVGSAILVVGSYIVTYLLAARAVGVNIPVLTLLPLVAPVLLTMLIPVTVSGWGVRESAAAVLWGAMGLAPVDGVVVSVAYGLLVLFSSMPGGLVLIGFPRWIKPSAAPVSGVQGRKGHLGQDRSGGTMDVVPG